MQVNRALLLLLLLVLAGCFARPAEKTGYEGETIPSFKLLLLDSSTYFNTNSIPAGKSTVFFYFGPQCPYSIAQMEEIIEDMNILKDVQFFIFTTGSFSGLKEFNERFQLRKYDNITVGLDYAHFFPDYFETPGVPYTAIYGKNRRLTAAFVGKVYGRQIKINAGK